MRKRKDLLAYLRSKGLRVTALKEQLIQFCSDCKSEKSGKVVL